MQKSLMLQYFTKLLKTNCHYFSCVLTWDIRKLYSV